MINQSAPTKAHVETLDEAIDRVVASSDFGVASAAKRGRNPKFPYVPIVKFNDGGPSGIGHTSQVLAKAFVTRDEAIAHAQKVIDAERRAFARRLAMPNHRAEREHYGLPREIV